VKVHLGADLVYVPRLAKSLARPGFAERAFTPTELAQCAARPESLAGRWAAKEATMKALRHGLGEIPLTDVEVDSYGGEAPRLTLRGRAEELAQDARWSDVSVSISHDGDYALAVVLALEGPSE
jgi:holo-[acyl-carrier protein] synthase